MFPQEKGEQKIDEEKAFQWMDFEHIGGSHRFIQENITYH